MMDIKPIKTRTDYRAALEAIEKLMDAKANRTAESCLRSVELPTFTDTADDSASP